MMIQDFHTQLRQLRGERNISLEELSLQVCVSAGKLGRYESGEDIPSKETIFKLSNALEVPLSNLTDGLQLH
ncbi:helix-turn-helix transcriptional regulator [Viridibacillus sp. FSL R5-0477]|uniref:XRE family transcriptional regulator n=1 Tax=Viridibacillus arenosi FSL R5-213 TaxID=1227360 RepID=W4EMY3_9BACL|nr:helix-turn-helix transcriptional regulator [Viridibacillus arenosi]ETT81920.1 XRE family transcriptional regulator [Viridibacillus arenosi FSL R5-213]